jgi:hypothetical protein
MKPSAARTKDEMLNQRAEAREAKRRQKNAKKAKSLADQEYPGEKWKPVEDGIYLSPHRPIGKDTNYIDELRDAQILRDLGSTVYLVPEARSDRKKKYDAIVNGMMMEFKNVGGNANTLFTHFLESREQAPNVFINLETSNLTRGEVMGALYGARNSLLRMSSRGTPIRGYAEHNRYSGGRIILKLKGFKNLIYLNVDDLKAR